MAFSSMIVTLTAVSIIGHLCISGVFSQVPDGPDRAAARRVRARAALWGRCAAVCAGRVPRHAQGQEGYRQELQDVRTKDLRGTGNYF